MKNSQWVDLGVWTLINIFTTSIIYSTAKVDYGTDHHNYCKYGFGCLTSCQASISYPGLWFIAVTALLTLSWILWAINYKPYFDNLLNSEE